MDRRSFLSLTAAVPLASIGLVNTDDHFTPIEPCGEFICGDQLQVLHETVRVFNPDNPDQYIDIQRVRGLKRFPHEIDLTAK